MMRIGFIDNRKIVRRRECRQRGYGNPTENEQRHQARTTKFQHVSLQTMRNIQSDNLFYWRATPDDDEHYVYAIAL
jgi:hypothetical protein